MSLTPDRRGDWMEKGEVKRFTTKARREHEGIEANVLRVPSCPSWFMILRNEKLMRIAIRSIFVACLCLSQLFAQQPKRVIVHAGKVLDVKTGRTLSNQAIVIEGEKIVSIGGDAKPNAGDQVIDLPSATVLPGLIDAHTHLTGDPRDI